MARSPSIRTRSFVYNHPESALVISVEFPDEWQAETFAMRFDGKVDDVGHYLS
jgi:hypothetical protein